MTRAAWLAPFSVVALSALAAPWGALHESAWARRNAIDPKTHELTAVGHESRGVKTPRNFAIEPTGKFMLVANQSGNDVHSFLASTGI